jgi:hypothetical protein
MKTILLFILISASIHLILPAQEPVSFRSQALGGIISDDLDLIYDPIELRFVDSVRLYTNLSNLTSGQEQLMNNYSNNEFLFGISIGNPFIKSLWSSALFRYKKDHTSEPVMIDRDLDGLIDLEERGEYHDIYSALLDTDFNGLYDFRREINQKKNNFNLERSHSLILNNSLLMNETTIGLQLAIGGGRNEHTIASSIIGSGTGGLTRTQTGNPSFELTYDTYLLNEDLRNFNRKESGDYLNWDESSFASVRLSGMQPITLGALANVELRGDLSFLHESRKTNFNDHYAGILQNFLPDTVEYLDMYAEWEKADHINEWSGNLWGIGAGLKKVFDQAYKRKNDGFWAVYVGLNFGSYDYAMSNKNTFRSLDSYYDGIDTLQQDQNLENMNVRYTEDNGSESRMDLFSSFRINIPLKERVYFGTGLSVNCSKSERNTDWVETIINSEDFDILDTLNALDYTRIATGNSLSDRTYETSLYTVRVPVGIEYKFTENKKWSLRFGSIFEYWKLIVNDKLQIKKSEPLTEMTEYGSGTVTITIEDNIFSSSSSHTKDSRSTTTFLYGLGYQPTDNLQIDLLGFFGHLADNQIIDANFFRSLRLSFSLKL